MSTTEHRPAAPASTPQPVTPFRMPTRRTEPSFTDERRDGLPVVEPRPTRVRPGRPHRARAGELAALAFALPLPIPAQRGPSED